MSPAVKLLHYNKSHEVAEMTMIISEADVKLLFRFATERAGDAVGVRASLGVGTDVILGEIRLRNASLANALEEFLGAYGEWFHFHQDLDAAGKQGRMSASEHDQLAKLSDDKDRAREAFIKELEAVTAA
jgi:hypothetical protein